MKMEEVLVELLKDINAKINHIEDITADNRAIIVKLVKQSNQVVNFLKQIDIEEVEEESFFEDSSISDDFGNRGIDKAKYKALSEILDEYMSKHKELKEFEDELKKHKDKLTPGQVGES